VASPSMPVPDGGASQACCSTAAAGTAATTSNLCCGPKRRSGAIRHERMFSIDGGPSRLSQRFGPPESARVAYDCAPVLAATSRALTPVPRRGPSDVPVNHGPEHPQPVWIAAPTPGYRAVLDGSAATPTVCAGTAQARRAGVMGHRDLTSLWSCTVRTLLATARIAYVYAMGQ
jgi:hypothetical protein